MFILNPDQYLLPDYKISPFQTRDIAFNNSLPKSSAIDAYFQERFNERNFVYTVNGRSALNKAFRYYNLQSEDVITILTTSGNHYVSSCVTNEANKFCKWNREIVAATKVIVVVHEFGYPFTGWEEIKKHDIPIIEDCAYSFFSDDEMNSINRTGDFVIYSFPKMFPLQIGGLLLSRKAVHVATENWVQVEMEQYIKNVLSFYIEKKEEIIQKRVENYRWLKGALASLGLEERSALPKGVVPGAFLFKVEDKEINLKDLRDYLFKHGIQCSVFYGENSFFIPLHQELHEPDLQYICEIIANFFKRS